MTVGVRRQSVRNAGQGWPLANFVPRSGSGLNVCFRTILAQNVTNAGRTTCPVIQSPSACGEREKMRKGFTLLEMVLVVVLTATLSVFAVPNMRGTLKKVMLTRAANDAASLMRYAQSRAIVRQCRVRLDLDEAGQSYRIAAVPEDEAAREEEQPNVIPGRWGRRSRMPAGVECVLSTNPLYFYSDGRMDKGRMTFCRADRCLTVSTQDQRNRVLMLEGLVE